MKKPFYGEVLLIPILLLLLSLQINCQIENVIAETPFTSMLPKWAGTMSQSFATIPRRVRTFDLVWHLQYGATSYRVSYVTDQTNTIDVLRPNARIFVTNFPNRVFMFVQSINQWKTSNVSFMLFRPLYEPDRVTIDCAISVPVQSSSDVTNWVDEDATPFDVSLSAAKEKVFRGLDHTNALTIKGWNPLNEGQ